MDGMPLRSSSKKVDATLRKLSAKREELLIAQEELDHIRDITEDARIRALVSETPLSQREWQDHERHLEVAKRNLVSLEAQVEELAAKGARLQFGNDPFLDGKSLKFG